MGWKSIKEHYKIEHFVQVTENGICIGSAYIHDIITILPDGTLKPCRSGVGSSNADLTRYMKEMSADRETLKRLIAQPDVFTRSITVYTYEDGNILEKQCEEVGWPNVTHDGLMMYDNKFSTDRSKVVGWARRNAVASLQSLVDRRTETRASLKKIESRIEEWQGHLKQLDEKECAASLGAACLLPGEEPQS